MKVEECLKIKGYTLTNDNNHVVAVSYSDFLEIAKEYAKEKCKEQRELDCKIVDRFTHHGGSFVKSNINNFSNKPEFD